MWTALAALPKFLPMVVSVIGSMERILGPKKGKEKQAEATSILSTVAPFLGGGLDFDTFMDDDVQKALRNLIDAIVGFLNALRDHRAKRAAG